jgi:hypothetical protein
MISPQHIGGIKGGKKCELTNSGCSLLRMVQDLRRKGLEKSLRAMAHLTTGDDIALSGQYWNHGKNLYHN